MSRLCDSCVGGWEAGRERGYVRGWEVANLSASACCCTGSQESRGSLGSYPTTLDLGQSGEWNGQVKCTRGPISPVDAVGL